MKTMHTPRHLASRAFFLSTLLLAACGGRLPESTPPDPDSLSRVASPELDQLVIYSGRSENLVGPLIEQFEQRTGIKLLVRWGNTSEIAATLLEEGENSPADIFFAQDPGGLGAVVDMLSPLPDQILGQIDERFRDPQGRWVGISGRARVIVYNTDRLNPQDLPKDLWGFTDPEWKGRIGWPPTNASFQTMITAMRVLWGEAQTREWLEGIQANEPRVYEKNTPTVAATAAGEVDVGFVNHYYLFRFLEEEGEGFPARNYFLPGGGPGSLVMVSGAGVLDSSARKEAAWRFLEFLLSQTAQTYFSNQTFEYPLVNGIPIPGELVPLEDLDSPDIGLASLADLEGTVALLREVGILP